MISGGCLCRGVRYEISGNLFMAANCHCSMCRKAHRSVSNNFQLATRKRGW